MVAPDILKIEESLETIQEEIGLLDDGYTWDDAFYDEISKSLSRAQSGLNKVKRQVRIMDSFKKKYGICISTLTRLLECKEVVELVGRANQQGIYCHYPSEYLTIDFKNKCISMERTNKVLKFKDYGKTWALNKRDIKYAF